MDEEVVQDGARVLIDSKAQLTLLGTEMDYVHNPLSSEFVFNNPNIKGTCGCGESFSIWLQLECHSQKLIIIINIIVSFCSDATIQRHSRSPQSLPPPPEPPLLPTPKTASHGSHFGVASARYSGHCSRIETFIGQGKLLLTLAVMSNECFVQQKISQEPAMQYILAQARVHDMTDGRVCRPVNELRFLANVYACYLNSNRRFNELQARYGSKEKSVEDAAKTVGLSVPKKPKD